MQKIVVLIMFLFCFISCENEIQNSKVEILEEVLVPTSAFRNFETKQRLSEYSDSSFEFDELAKYIAKKLNDKSFRKYLKNEANKQFDGDFNILLKENKQIFKEFENLIENNEKLNIGFNSLIEKWDTEKNSLLVANRIGLNSDAENLVAYDINGNSYLIDSKIDPDKPIIVLGLNERINYMDGKIQIMKFQNSAKSNSSKFKILACSFPNRSGSAKYEYLKEIKFQNLSTYEPWYDFKPEIKYTCYAPSSGNNFASVGKINEQGYNPNRNEIDNCWYIINTPLFVWNTPAISSTLLNEFIEIDDYGQSQTFTIGLSQTFGIASNNKIGTPNITGSVTPSIGYSYTIKAKDTVIGRHPIEMQYCPPNSDDSYQFGGGNSAFYYKSGYN